MCGVCGCGEGEVTIDGILATGHHHNNDKDSLDFSGEVAHVHASEEVGKDESRQKKLLRIEQDILAKNDGFAISNRARLNGLGLLTLNLVSSPGAGKTTLLTSTINALNGKIGVAVIEGDQATANDAERIRKTGVTAVQINTGRGCHLDAHMIGHAIDGLELQDTDVLFIENVGNLVCPAAFDLGEHHKVAILSVTEGEDKPLKYPDMFAASDLMILNKIDLLPYVDFDVERCVEYARSVNPNIDLIKLSAYSSEGMETWLNWIDHAQGRMINDKKRIRLNLETAVDQL